ncbi:unnamed protein product [Prorocentrum cordatum]|uniref:OAR domain-containing protein n=1 Tax=Prorocentrum cordatum TaxID=2364126 RepID=A0ABN9WUD4_9DINO|nr:unnamed protein product [Polarella glacialis]
MAGGDAGKHPEWTCKACVKRGVEGPLCSNWANRTSCRHCGAKRAKGGKAKPTLVDEGDGDSEAAPAGVQASPGPVPLTAEQLAVEVEILEAAKVKYGLVDLAVQSRAPSYRGLTDRAQLVQISQDHLAAKKATEPPPEPKLANVLQRRDAAVQKKERALARLATKKEARAKYQAEVDAELAKYLTEMDAEQALVDKHEASIQALARKASELAAKEANPRLPRAEAVVSDDVGHLAELLGQACGKAGLGVPAKMQAGLAALAKDAKMRSWAARAASTSRLDPLWTLIWILMVMRLPGTCSGSTPGRERNPPSFEPLAYRSWPSLPRRAGASGAGQPLASRTALPPLAQPTASRSGSSAAAQKRSWRSSEFVVISANGSGWGPLTALWSDESTMRSHRADCWCVQETQLFPKRLAAQEQWCRQHGVAAALTAGVARASSQDVEQRRAASSGTGVVVRSNRGMAEPDGAGSRHVDAEGRCTAVLLSGMQRGGVLMASLFILAGDRNVGPKQLCEEGSAWLQGIGGAVVSNHGGRPTTRKGLDVESELDFFVVSNDLLPRLQGCSVDPGPVRPHSAARLQLRAHGAAPLERRLKAPRPFPTQRAIGPSPAPVEAPPEVLRACESADSPEALDASRLQVMRLVESELPVFHQIAPTDEDSFKGRGLPPPFRRQQPDLSGRGHGSSAPRPKEGTAAKRPLAVADLFGRRARGPACSFPAWAVGMMPEL